MPQNQLGNIEENQDEEMSEGEVVTYGAVGPQPDNRSHHLSKGSVELPVL